MSHHRVVVFGGHGICDIHAGYHSQIADRHQVLLAVPSDLHTHCAGVCILPFSRNLARNKLTSGLPDAWSALKGLAQM